MPDDDAPDDVSGREGPEDPGREGVSLGGAASPEAPGDASGLDATPPEGIPASALEAPPEGSAAEAYERRARLAEDRLGEVLAAYRKLKLDNDAYRGRLTKNFERRYEQRRERLLLKFIDILDNLDRALEAAETTYTGEPMIEGLILVRTQLLQTLQDEGLERIPVLGLAYDPATSEAVQTQAVDDPEHHHVVIKELMRGYRLNGRIARAARVVVGEHRPEAKATAVAEPAAEAGTGGEGPAPATEEATVIPTAIAPANEESAVVPQPEPTLEEIIAKAQAQEALFPEAFSPPAGEEALPPAPEAFSPVDADEDAAAPTTKPAPEDQKT